MFGIFALLITVELRVICNDDDLTDDARALCRHGERRW